LTKSWDVLVVGAGILGVASAYHLKKNNPDKQVLLVDRYGAAGQGNTGRSNAMFRNTFSSSDNQVLADSSIDFYLQVQKGVADIGLQQIGYLWLMTDEGLSSSERHLTKMEENGIEVRRLALSDLRRLLPGMTTSFEDDPDAGLMKLPPVEGALFGPKCGRLDPDKLVRFYLGQFMKLGGEVSFNTNVERLNLAPNTTLGLPGEPLIWQDSVVDGVRATGASGNEIRAETIVLACGAWGNELLEPAGYDGHVKAKKRQLFSLPAKGSERLTKLLRTRGFSPLGLLPMVILPKSGVHFKPVVEENEFWVACEDNLNRPYIDIPEKDLGRYAAEPSYFENGIYPVLRSYFPDFEGVRPRSMWAGLYSYNTIDFLPFALREGNLIVVGGDSGSGIMKGDSLGRIVDALYRDAGDAVLHGDVHYQVDRIGFRKRAVEREEWVL
jgi:FAD-dependent oxidoreductase domain-containing protein 1